MKELINIQSELKAPKSQFNNFGKYKYRNCEDILEAVKPLLKKENCFLTISDEVKEIGTNFYVQATATITNSEGLQISVNAQAGIDILKKGMDISQCYGSSSSYARKYALNGLFLIDDTKDADSSNDGNDDTLLQWKAEINKCKSLEDLETLYSQNKVTDKNVQSLFTKRKLEIQNGSK